jgi:hypothetical protein
MQRIEQRLNAMEFRAIGWYCDEHHLIPLMSAYPKMEFKHRTTNELSSEDVSVILSQYKSRSRAKARA